MINHCVCCNSPFEGETPWKSKFLVGSFYCTKECWVDIEGPVLPRGNDGGHKVKA